ncbi:MAG TPA: hypothetical protein VM163_10305 [bacterium]|nr:hypothetical protein [bacterium]
MRTFRWIFLTCFVLIVAACSAGACLAQGTRIVGHWTGLGESDVGDGVTGELFDSLGTYYYDIGVDSADRPNLVWSAATSGTVQTTNGVVKFAYWDGDIWRGMENPDGPDSFGPGVSCQLVNLPGGPAVIYDSAEITAYPELHYMMWNGTAWQQDLSTAMAQIQAVDYRVRLDGLAKPHFVYLHYENGVNYLYYSFWNGTSLEGLGGSDEGEGIDAVPYIYGFSSFWFALDSRSFPHVVYSGAEGGAFYAFWDGSSWQRVAIKDIFGFSSPSPRIAIDTQDHPHVTLLDTSQSPCDIYYVYWDGQQLVYPNRDAGGVSQGKAGWDANGPNIAIDLYGNANICYGMGSAIYLRYCPSGEAEFFTYGFGDVGWGVLPPPEYKENWGNIDMFSGPKIAVSEQGQAYVAYVTKFIVPSARGPLKWRPVCRVRAFLPEPASNPLLALDTTKRHYYMERGDDAVSLVLGIDNQQDEWADIDLYLAVSEEQLLYRFSWWCLPLSLPPNFYLPPSTVITVPITPADQGGIFCPPVGGRTDEYVTYAGFFRHGTGEALGPIQWNKLLVTGIKE